MSKITIELTRTDVSKTGNHFIVVQLDETEFPSGLKRTQKFRTEIEWGTEYPQFLKTYFEFRGVTLGNRLIIRIGLFNTSLSKPEQEEDSECAIDIPSNILFQNSRLIGANDITFTSTMMNTLRNHKWAENDIRLFHPEKEDTETGHVFIKLAMKSETIDSKIYEDNKEIEECYYDPFETDSEKIRESLKRVIVLNEEKQIKLGKQIKELDRINNTVKTVAIDKQKVLCQINDREEENNLLRRNLDLIQNYEEIHIEVDILSQSNQGVQMLEKKYAVLLSQLSLQSEYHHDLDRDYEEIDSVLSKIKIIKDKIANVKTANLELKFNIKRQEDQLPLITMYEEKLKNNEKLITNLRENVSQVIKKNEYEIKKTNQNVNNIEEVEEKIKLLYQDRKILEEKTVQMNLYSNIHKSNNLLMEEDETASAYHNFIKITGSGLDPVMNKIVKEGENHVFKSYQDQIFKLTDEVNELTHRLEKINKIEKEKKENQILLDPNIKIKKSELISKNENVNSRERALLEELDSSQLYFRHSLGKIKQRIEDAEKVIGRIYRNYENNKYNRRQRKSANYSNYSKYSNYSNYDDYENDS